LKAWTECLKKKSEAKDDTSTDQLMDTDTPQQQANKPGGEPHIKVNYLF
jgi:hypothetical protein